MRLHTQAQAISLHSAGHKRKRTADVDAGRKGQQQYEPRCLPAVEQGETDNPVDSGGGLSPASISSLDTQVDQREAVSR